MARLIVSISVVFLLAAARSVEACDCASAGPPCSAVWKADAVFVGRADRTDGATVRFAVERRVRGVSSAEILVDRGGGNCAYAFAAGERYVVYAYRNRETGVLTTSICSATKPLTDAPADVAYFDELNGPSTGGRVYGRISHLEIDFETGRGVDHGPVEDLRLTVMREASTRRVATNAAGQFEVRGLAPGRYEVDIEIPPGFVPWRRASFELVNDGACVEWNSVIRFDGRIGGTLLDESGNPASGVAVEAAGAGTRGGSRPPPRTVTATTRPDGSFELGPLPPGDYVVGTELSRPPRHDKLDRRRYLPGVRSADAAHIVHLDAGSRVTVGPFRLPAFPTERVIEGTVLWPDGTPAAGATVVLDGAGPEEHPTPDGRFRFVLPYGARFIVSARIRTDRAGRAVNARSMPAVIVDRDDHDRSIELPLKLP